MDRPVTNGLPPNQRSIMLALAIGAMAERTGSDAETAENQLDQYAIRLHGDHDEAILSVASQILIRAPRAWLAGLDGDR
jgi:hypothetical protein